MIELIDYSVDFSFKLLNYKFLTLTADQRHLHCAFGKSFFLTSLDTLLSSNCIVVQYFLNRSISLWQIHCRFVFRLLNHIVLW